MEYECENQDSDNAKELSFSALNWFLTMVKAAVLIWVYIAGIL